MSKRSPRATKESEIEREWYARPDDQRTRNHVEEFADDMHRQGLSLHQNSTLNVQAVRALLRLY